MELYEKVSDNLLGLEKSINNGLDFDASKKRGKPIIKYGLDNVLDESKFKINCIYILVTLNFWMWVST